jgi:tRNA G10  N-methylase Trm11
MKYFFILGNHPALSLAELVSIFGSGRLESYSAEAAVFELEENNNFDAVGLMRRLGGTIKLGNSIPQIAGLNSKNNLEKILEAVEGVLPKEKGEGKFKFGISVYGKLKLNEKMLGMEVKKVLKESGVSARWVTSREKQLSSVVVDTNKLIGEKGAEIVILKINEKIFIGKTLVVQPFRELSFRDYGRPGRDDLSGMLPPKLAQMMINLANPLPASPLRRGRSEAGQEEIKILDPFCGSGTVLTEAMLMGCENVYGSDISEKAVDDTKENIKWIKEKFEIRNLKLEIFNKSATELSQFIAPKSVDAIVTEPYLGPQRGNIDIGKVKRELEKLYGEALREFNKVLKPGGRVVMIWPVFKVQSQSVQKSKVPASSVDRQSPRFQVKSMDFGLSPDLHGFEIVKPKIKMSGITERGTYIYGREGQKVWREIVILVNKSRSQ